MLPFLLKYSSCFRQITAYWQQICTSFFLLWLLALLFLFWLFFAEFRDVDFLLALYNCFWQQLKHIVEVSVDLKENT